MIFNENLYKKAIVFAQSAAQRSAGFEALQVLKLNGVFVSQGDTEVKTFFLHLSICACHPGRAPMLSIPNSIRRALGLKLRVHSRD